MCLIIMKHNLHKGVAESPKGIINLAIVND